MRRFQLNKLVLLMGALSVSAAYAATDTAAVPASVNPANVSWDLQDQIYNPNVKKSPSFQVVPSAPAAPIAGTAATFVLKKIVFAGATHPVPEQVQAVYKRALNKPMDVNGLLALAQQMQDAYRAMGYVLVQVILPPQEIDKDKGAVTFQIIEGQIQNVIFTGDDAHGATKQLQLYAKAIEAEDPITYQSIDHFLVLANNLPGIDVSATLVPNKTVVGGADLIIDVKQTTVSAFANFNNRGTPYIGPAQAFAGGSVYDLLGADSLSVTGATTTGQPSQLAYFVGNYNLVAGPYSTDVNLSVSETQTRPGGSLESLDMIGNSSKYALALNQPLIATSAQSVTLNTSFYHLDSDNNVFSNQLLYNDKISAFTLGATYQGVFWQTLNNFDAYATFGVPILGAPSTLDNPSRVNGTNKFEMLNFDTSSIHYLSQRISFDLASSGQVTPNPLLSSEQIGFGGTYFGQAFTPYIIAGDNGIMGSLSLRYDLPTFWGLTMLQPQVFYDIGMVANNDALPGTYANASGSSAGLGINLAYSNNFQLGFVVAKPLTLTQVINNANGWQSFVNFVAVF